MSWKYFKIADFNCHHCGENRMDSEFIDRLDALREECGFPLLVLSGYRCPTYNAQVSSTGTDGPHTKGRASDLKVDRGQAYTLTRLAIELGFTGLGFQQKGAVRFIHLDDLPVGPGQPRPTIWSY